jgi:phosphoribosylamine-glycine ligase
LCDGKNVAALATSQDHKRLLDGDEGPNTGGMGAYSPAPVVTAEVHARAMREVIMPTIRGMEKDGIHLHRIFVRWPDDRLHMAASRPWNSIAAWATPKPNRF